MQGISISAAQLESLGSPRFRVLDELVVEFDRTQVRVDMHSERASRARRQLVQDREIKANGGSTGPHLPFVDSVEVLDQFERRRDKPVDVLRQRPVVLRVGIGWTERTVRTDAVG